MTLAKFLPATALTAAMVLTAPFALAGEEAAVLEASAPSAAAPESSGASGSYLSPASVLPTSALPTSVLPASLPALPSASAAGSSSGSVSTLASDATALVPGQYANALIPAERSREEYAREREAANEAWRRRWMWSLGPLVASEALDASSSYGLRELNPVLADSDGRFGMKAVGIKFSVVGGLVGVEYLLIKKFPGSAKFFSVVNFSAAGITTGLAVHN